MNIIWDYIRMVCYVIIILTDLNGILKRKFSNSLFLGDIIMATGLFLTLFHFDFLKKDLMVITDFILTPTAIVWAVVHFSSMLKYNRIDKHDNNK